MLNDKFGWNVLAIQIWKNLPFQLLIIASVLQTIRTDIEDAARNLGASPLQVIWHIVLPLSIPGILIAVVLVFILTFGDYAITGLPGPVYPSSLSVLMYTKAFTLQQWGGAACIGMVIIVTSLLFVAIYARAARAIQEMRTMTAEAYPMSAAATSHGLGFAHFIALADHRPAFGVDGGAAVHGGHVVAGKSGRSVVAAGGSAAELLAGAVGICLHLFGDRPGRRAPASSSRRSSRSCPSSCRCRRPMRSAGFDFPRQGSAAHPDPAARS